MSDKSKNSPETAPRPGQPGNQNERRPGPSPLSDHPTGPHEPYSADDSDGPAAKQDAKGQYANSQAKPNPGGLVSANPVVLSKDGEASPEGGHGRERDSETQR